MEPFAYQKLESQEIRILVLSPGAGRQPLSGRVITRKLSHYIEALATGTTDNDIEAFEALSYAWESPRRHLSFTTQSGIIKVTASLALALQRLRYTEQDRLLWADGICINQDDLDEREQQVRLMGDIYRSARRTVVFLGEGDESVAGIDMLVWWWKYYIAPYGINGRSVDASEERIGMKLSPLPENSEPPPPKSDERWLAARKIWLQPWFRRLWIVQEFVLARDVIFVFGVIEFPWQHLWLATMNSSASIPGDTWLGEPDVYDIVVSFSTLGTLRIIRIESNNENSRSLDELIVLLPGRLASVQQDYFFGLLGLATDADRDEIQPDYKSPAKTVVSKIARYLIHQPWGLELFSRAGLGGLRLDIPSWAGGLTGPLQPVWSISCRKFAAVPDYQAAGLNPFKPVFSPDDESILLLSGKSIDVIQTVFQFHTRSTFLPQSYDAFLASGLELGNIPFDIAVARTVVADKFISPSYSVSAQLPDDKTLQLGLQYWIARKRGKSEAESIQDVSLLLDFADPESIRKAALIFNNSYNCMRDRHDLFPCVTSTRRPGMVSKFCEPGDQVWIISGCPCPMMLRPSPTRQGCFKLLGSAYIFGIMYGEAVKNGFEFRDVQLD
jgi:hypothetical protein